MLMLRSLVAAALLPWILFALLVALTNPAHATITGSYSVTAIGGNGVTTAWSYPFPFFATSDLAVTLKDGAGNPVASVLNGGGTYDYTVTGTYSANQGEYASGGTVTFTTAPPAGYSGQVGPAVPAIQPAVLSDYAPLPAKQLEGVLDRFAVLAQQVKAGQLAATVSTLGLVKPDGTTCNVAAGVLSCAGPGGGLFSSISSAAPTIASTGLNAWVNQGSNATAQDDPGIGTSIADAVNDGLNLRLRCRAAPTPPYTITARLGATLTGVNFVGAGFGWRDAGSGKMELFQMQHTPLAYVVIRWASPTSSSSVDGTLGAGPPRVWVRLVDDGTTATWRWSESGGQYLTGFAVAKSSSYLGSSGYNQLCAYVIAQGGGAALELESWAQS